MLFTQFLLIVPMLLTPLPPVASRDWRLFDEFEVVREWRLYPPDGGEYRCTEAYCPGGTPERFFLYVSPGEDWLVDHVQMGHMDDAGNWHSRRMNSGRATKNQWRAVMGDFEQDIPDGESFYIRVWCVHKGGTIVPTIIWPG